MPKQPTLTPELLTAALEGLQAQRKRIDDQIAEIRRILGQRSPVTTDGAAPLGRKRTMSAAGRRRIAAAQKARWAAVHNAQGTAPKKHARRAAASKTATAQPTKKRRISAQGLKRIAEATRKRWTAFRAAKKATNK